MDSPAVPQALAIAMAIGSQDIHAQTSIAPDAALALAREYSVERWFYDHVLHKRTLQDRVEANTPLKERELDRFYRLTLLIERTTETFQNDNKALSWLQTLKRSMGGTTPLEYGVRESGFLAVLLQLTRIAHGIYA